MHGIFNSLARRVYSKYQTAVVKKNNPLLFNPKSKKEIIESFHNLYYLSSANWYNKTKWMGVNILKCPFDLWVYQEIITEIKPDLIIETGTYFGGTTLYLANLCDILGHGEILSIDINHPKNLPKHKRITYLKGSSTSPGIRKKIKDLTKVIDKVLVILDSDHREPHVTKEIEFFHKIVTKGSYLIVEDSNINGHPTDPNYGPGPHEAIEKFLKKNKDFKTDKSKEYLMLTFNPDGYLKRIK